ncbi:MAG: radical SAM protein [Chloroflexota bacterium]
MDATSQLRELSTGMAFEPDVDYDAGQAGCPRLNVRQQDAVQVSTAQMPNGRQIKFLKTLLTSACERNCYYCPFRSGRDFRRATLSADEMAGVFMSMHRAGLVQGLFLSSGVAGGSLRTQDQILATAELLRKKYAFQGYVHLKLMPGAQQAQVEQAMKLADRVSLNLEAPNTERLAHLAPRKLFMEELLQPLRWVDQIRRNRPDHHGWNGRWPSLTTQFVVGAVGESDLELLQTTAYLQQRLHLARAYFSAFHPVPDTPFEDRPAEARLRQNRLYQASFLLRDYGFGLEDLPFEGQGNLPLRADPKQLWAQAHLAEQPLEINCAGRQELLRVPGIGPQAASAIINARRAGRLRDVGDLKRLGIRPERALPFILLDGRRAPHQLRLPDS